MLYNYKLGNIRASVYKITDTHTIKLRRYDETLLKSYCGDNYGPDNGYSHYKTITEVRLKHCWKAVVEITTGRRQTGNQ